MSLQAKITATAGFLQDAPPGETKDVFEDIKVLVEDDEDLINGLQSAFAQYNIDQLVTVTLPGVSKPTVLSKFNQLAPNRFFDLELGKSFTLEHKSLHIGTVEDYETPSDVIGSIILDVKHYVSEHYPDPAAYGVHPQSDDELAIVIVGTKFSPGNFWNGKWKSTYIVNLTTGSLKGTVSVDVHYFEDGNVRFKSSASTDSSFNPSQTLTIIQSISSSERKYQEELNKQFAGLSDGVFKSLRRQLPVTRSKIEWGKSIGTYRLGQDIGGGRSK
ncbi:F-actin-capping protein subunit alpha [Lipomyces arxii]|uniref:F-actin-capping protein subunit alpha n=1 Tax=Lipomyces arxii TaxID=56418 RepID=UPI0034CD809A